MSPTDLLFRKRFTGASIAESGIATVQNCSAPLSKGKYINSLAILGQRAFAKFPNFMKWLKRVGAVLGVIVLILAAVPFFISLEGSIPTIEREVSARLKGSP
jgi:hypothetical protein